MNRRSLVGLALVLSIGVNVGFAATAFLRHRVIERIREGPPPGREPGEFLADRLDLDPATRARFLARQRELARTVRELRPRVGDLERDLRAELVSDAPDRARIASLQDDLAAVARELDRAFTDAVLDSREILDGPAERRYLRFVERFPGARRPFVDGGPPRPPGADAPRGERLRDFLDRRRDERGRPPRGRRPPARDEEPPAGDSREAPPPADVPRNDPPRG